MNSLKALIIKYKTRIYDIATYSTGNAISQAMNMLVGFLIIRALDKTEYGYYTIAFTIFIMLTQLSDIGVSIGLNSIGGRTWNDKNKFSALIVTAESIRRRMILFISLPIIIYGFVILLSNGNNLFNSLALLTIVAVTGFFEIERLVLLTIPKFYGNIKFIRNNELMGSAAKLLLVIISALLFKNPIYFLIPFFIATAVQLRFLRMEKKQNIRENVKVDNEFKTEIIGYIKSNALNTFYYIFQGQLFILLLTFFGNVTNIAEIGALSRFSVIFNVVNSLFLNYFVPDFAKAKGYDQTKKKFLLLLVIIGLISFSIIMIFGIIPEFFLFILGKDYYGLNYELVLLVAVNSCTSIFGSIWLLNAAKGWVKFNWLYVPFTIFLQILLLDLLDLSKLYNIIIFNGISLIPSFIVSSIISIMGFIKIKKFNII